MRRNKTSFAPASVSNRHSGTFQMKHWLPHGAYFGVASLVAASLVPANERARAVGRMMLGLTGATLAGVPLATWLGQLFGWRAAYVLVAGIGVLTCVLISRLVPRDGPVEGASPARELSALSHKQVWLTLGVGSIGFGGLFCVYSYISPTLTQVSGLPVRYVPFVLAVFGGGMILGNLRVGWGSARRGRPVHLRPICGRGGTERALQRAGPDRCMSLLAV
jgi:predicted MFS family arabinose efflux permease